MLWLKTCNTTINRRSKLLTDRKLFHSRCGFKNYLLLSYFWKPSFSQALRRHSYSLKFNVEIQRLRMTSLDPAVKQNNLSFSAHRQEKLTDKGSTTQMIHLLRAFISCAAVNIPEVSLACTFICQTLQWISHVADTCSILGELFYLDQRANYEKLKFIFSF